MKPNPREEAARWLRQATNDLASARVLLREGFYAQACFTAQQVTEKALKGLAYAQGERAVLGHGNASLIDRLVEPFPELARHRDMAGRLDQYYVSSRYPNAVPGKAPFEVYTRDQAQEAVEGAAAIVRDVERMLNVGG